MLLPFEAILEEPEELHLTKEKQNKPKQATYKFANNTFDTGSSENELQAFISI